MSRPSRAGDGGLGLAVFPFRPTVAEATQWSEAIPDLLATQLEGTPAVRVIDPWSLWRSLRAQRGQIARSPDPDEGQDIARTARARNFVVGFVAQLGDRLIVSVRL